MSIWAHLSLLAVTLYLFGKPLWRMFRKNKVPVRSWDYHYNRRAIWKRNFKRQRWFQRLRYIPKHWDWRDFA
jgi:hypothetical protein